MKQLTINNLCIEVTRKCNMKCPHCMRGESQNISLETSTIENLFNNPELKIISINQLVITGGEPTLNYRLILDIINQIIQNNIALKSFIMVINGSKYNKELVDALNILYQYKLTYDKKETFDIICSLDQFHRQPKKEIIEKYRNLPYFKGNYKMLNPEDIICLGRAYLNKLGNPDTYYYLTESLLYCLYNNHPNKFETDNMIYLNQLYLSSKGLYGFYIMDATYDMIDKLCIYNESKIIELLDNNKIKRK